MTANTYQSYRGLPTLAGLATMEEAANPGLSVDECTRRLKRFHYAFVRLHEIFTARITAEPVYELKCGFSHHAYLCAEHVSALRARVSEMREPPLGLEDIPHPQLKTFFDEILAAPSTMELLVGLYEKAIPALQSAIERYNSDTNPLTDAPTKRVLRFANLELADMKTYGQQCIDCLSTVESREGMVTWCGLIDDCLAVAGSLDGCDESIERTITPKYSTTPYKFDPIPRRDERFRDPWNQGVNAEAFLYTEEFDPKSKSLMMLYKRIREIDVPEMMAGIIVETRGKTWQYYRDMTRQLWDEARHAMMGEVGFVALGLDWTQACITHNWSYRLNTECSPLERHAVLFFIEQGLMTRTGKRFEWEVAQDSGIPLMATIQDFDWADEVLHAQIGRAWYIPELGDLKQALDYGDKCWSRILSNWQQVKDQGLTEHANWWPDLYKRACEIRNEQPDPKVLAFDTTYAEQRADLKSVTGSA